MGARARLRARAGENMKERELQCPRCLSSYTGIEYGEICKQCGQGTIKWVPEWKDLVDALPESFLCPRRSAIPNTIVAQICKDDHWEKFKFNGQRVCSFCGSLHPDDFFALVKQSAEASTDEEWNSAVEIEQSDKDYKYYVHQPLVRNAQEGGIKFYRYHLNDVSDEQREQFMEAIRRTRARWNKILLNMKQGTVSVHREGS